MKSRLVYSTGVGRICESCAQPMDACRCAQGDRASESVPEKITARLRLETSGRAGKAVTVVFGLPNNGAFLDELASTLKRSCGTGGTVRPGAVELAGDVRERVRGLLAARGWGVKG